MQKSKFSIITPCFNNDDVIERCINSVKSQSFKNYEHIIINDGSTDKTDKIIRKNLNNKIQYLSFEKNKGIAAARNKGLDNVQGDWLIFLDADDELGINSLKYLSEIISIDSIDKKDYDEYLFLTKVYKNNKLVHKSKYLTKKKEFNSNEIFNDNYVTYETGGCQTVLSFKNHRFDERLCKYGNELLIMIDVWKDKKFKLLNKHFRIKHIDAKTSTRKTINKKKMLLAGEAEEKIAIKFIDVFGEKISKNKIGFYFFSSGFNYVLGGNYSKGLKNMVKSFNYTVSLRNLIYFVISLFGSFILTKLYMIKHKNG